MTSVSVDTSPALKLWRERKDMLQCSIERTKKSCIDGRDTRPDLAAEFNLFISISIFLSLLFSKPAVLRHT